MPLEWNMVEYLQEPEHDFLCPDNRQDPYVFHHVVKRAAFDEFLRVIYAESLSPGPARFDDPRM